jgi:hypothetical protein
METLYGTIGALNNKAVAGIFVQLSMKYLGKLHHGFYL